MCMQKPDQSREPVSAAELAGKSWPGLLRGMPVTVERPWSTWLKSPLNIKRLFWAVVAWRIRANSGGGRASHAMTYVGGGKLASQDVTYSIVDLATYSGCTLRFWSPPEPGWSDAQRDRLVALKMLRKGDRYSWQGLLAKLLESKTGMPFWASFLDEPADICSEEVCEDLLEVDPSPGYVSELTCAEVSPNDLEAWMTANGWTCITIRLA